MRHLTTSASVLWDEVVAGLAGEGFTFDSLTETRSAFLARSLGDASAHLTKPFAQLLAELNQSEGGETVSHLTMGLAELLSTLATTLDGNGGGGEVFPPENAIIAADFVGGRYYADSQERTQGEFMTLNDATLDGSGLHTVSTEEPPSAGSSVLAVLNANLASGFTVVWDGSVDDYWWGMLGLYPESDPGMAGTAVEVNDSGVDHRPRVDDWNEATAKSTGDGYVASSRNRVAITLYRNVGGGVYRTAVSLNGSTIVMSGGGSQSGQDFSYGMDTHLVEILYAAICGSSAVAGAGGANGTFTEFIVYPAVHEDDLPALSALG